MTKMKSMCVAYFARFAVLALLTAVSSQAAMDS
jgi:hypothetical protein